MLTLTQRIAGFLHLGKIPGKIRTTLEGDGGILYLAESIAVSATFRDFRAPGVYVACRKMASVGFVAISEARLVARARPGISVNVAFHDAAFHKINFAVHEGYLALRFDAVDHIPRASGTVEIRLHVPDIPVMAEVLKTKRARVRV